MAGGGGGGNAPSHCQVAADLPSVGMSRLLGAGTSFFKVMMVGS